MQDGWLLSGKIGTIVIRTWLWGKKYYGMIVMKRLLWGRIDCLGFTDWRAVGAASFAHSHRASVASSCFFPGHRALKRNKGSEP